MKLTDLNPRWFAEPGREGQGVVFLCPHCLSIKLAVAFANPLDGGAPIAHMNSKQDINPLIQALWQGKDVGHDIVPPGFHWTRSGTTFETLTLSPSVDASAAGHWHGHLERGITR